MYLLKRMSETTQTPTDAVSNQPSSVAGPVTRMGISKDTAIAVLQRETEEFIKTAVRSRNQIKDFILESGREAGLLPKDRWKVILGGEEAAANLVRRVLGKEYDLIFQAEDNCGSSETDGSEDVIPGTENTIHVQSVSQNTDQREPGGSRKTPIATSPGVPINDLLARAGLYKAMNRSRACNTLRLSTAEYSAFRDVAFETADQLKAPPRWMDWGDDMRTIYRRTILEDGIPCDLRISLGDEVSAENAKLWECFLYLSHSVTDDRKQRQQKAKEKGMKNIVHRRRAGRTGLPAAVATISDSSDPDDSHDGVGMGGRKHGGNGGGSAVCENGRQLRIRNTKPKNVPVQSSTRDSDQKLDIAVPFKRGPSQPRNIVASTTPDMQRRNNNHSHLGASTAKSPVEYIMKRHKNMASGHLLTRPHARELLEVADEESYLAFREACYLHADLIVGPHPPDYRTWSRSSKEEFSRALLENSDLTERVKRHLGERRNDLNKDTWDSFDFLVLAMVKDRMRSIRRGSYKPRNEDWCEGRSFSKTPHAAARSSTAKRERDTEKTNTVIHSGYKRRKTEIPQSENPWEIVRNARPTGLLGNADLSVVKAKEFVSQVGKDGEARFKAMVGKPGYTYTPRTPGDDSFAGVIVEDFESHSPEADGPSQHGSFFIDPEDDEEPSGHVEHASTPSAGRAALLAVMEAMRHVDAGTYEADMQLRKELNELYVSVRHAGSSDIEAKYKMMQATSRLPRA